MSETFEYDVFLSNSSKDKEIVHALAERLKKDGFACGWNGKNASDRTIMRDESNAV